MFRYILAHQLLVLRFCHAHALVLLLRFTAHFTWDAHSKAESSRENIAVGTANFRDRLLVEAQMMATYLCVTPPF